MNDTKYEWTNLIRFLWVFYFYVTSSQPMQLAQYTWYTLPLRHFWSSRLFDSKRGKNPPDSSVGMKILGFAFGVYSFFEFLFTNVSKSIVRTIRAYGNSGLASFHYDTFAYEQQVKETHPNFTQPKEMLIMANSPVFIVCIRFWWMFADVGVGRNNI